MAAPAEAPVPSADSTKRSRLYFGWYIVAGAFLAQMLQAGLSVYAGGVFLVPMTEDLDWSRTEFTLAQTLGQLVTGAIGFFIGAHVDRRGGRRVMLIGGTVIAVTLFSISYIEEWWQWMVLRGLFFMGGSAMIGSLVVNVTLSKWFVELRGRAIGIGAIGFS
ncbi:MAG: MFS transporter, partial [Chloroflexi bacterium]|nr:MFS transporter [Chloroflexota bacterium]